MDTERRSVPRVPLDAEVRIRAAGSSGRGIPCRVEDASSTGIRLRSPEEVGPGWIWVEVLKSSGQPLAEPLEARVARAEKDEHGYQRVGCSFD